jgi:hypothetical protein
MYLFCAGMYRACSTWQYNVVSLLVERHRGGERIGFLDRDYFAPYDATHPEDGRWRVVKVHDPCDVYAEVLAAGRGIVIYAYRDLRDVAFSFMHKAARSFDDLIRDGFFAKLVASDHYWLSQPRMFCQRYERLVEDQVRGVRELADFLEIDITDGEATQIATDFTWEANAKRTEDVTNRLREAGVDLNDPANIFQHDPHTLLHWNHLRAGRVGSWRDLATDPQRAAMARHCGVWLIQQGYESDDLWALPTSELIARLKAVEAELRAERERAASLSVECNSFHAINPLALKTARRLTRITERIAGTGKRYIHHH